ncbi:ATP-binding protein [Kiloniella sp. b19]|uniref:ATP-binding protein n=1 Tax=Kiloniella sp. GXU_MW_B19 TaxID=3141326 RepID=UPI0031E378E9
MTTTGDTRENKPTRSLTRFVSRRVLGFMVPALLAVFMVTYEFSYHSIEKHLNENIQSQLQAACKTLFKRFENTRSWLNNLSRNGLIVNSFVDPAGAGSYIPQLFKTLNVPGPQNGGHLILTDFKGDIIASNSNTENPNLDLDEAWLQDVLGGQSFERVNEQGLIIATPITINGLPEGAMILHFNPRTLSRFLRVSTINGIVNVASADSVLISTPGNQDSFMEGKTFAQEAHEDWAILQATIPGTGGLQLITAQEKEAAFEPVEDVKAAMIAFILIALGGMIISLSLSGRLISRNLRDFSRQIKEIREDNDLALRLSVSEITEVRELELSFNELMSALQNTTVSKDYIDKLFQGLPLPVFVLGLDGRINKQNSHAENSFTNREGEPLLYLQDAISRANLESHQELLVRDFGYRPGNDCDTLMHLPRIADRHEMEVELHQGHGHRKPCILSTTAIKGPCGEIIGFISSATDIEEQKRTEKEILKLAEENKLMARAIEEIDLGVTISDSQQKGHPIIFCNSAFTALSGREEEEILGHSCAFLQGPETDPETVRQISSALEDQRAITVEIQNYRKDGSSFWNELSLNPIFSRTGELKYYVGIQKDISERKRIDEMKKEFISTVSHELRTPLTAIHGSLGLMTVLKEHEPDSREKELVTVAYRNSERLKLLINDILDTEKLEAGAMRFEYGEHDLTELLQHCVILNTPFAEKYGVRFEIVGEIPGLTLSCDKNRMSQVLTNLMSNAAKFSRVNQTIELSVTRVPETDELQINVTDFGEGISDAFKQELFQKFAKQDASDDGDKPGTGLGLYISRKIVEAHKGKLTVESELGKGSTFTISLPLKEASARDETAKPEQADYGERPTEITYH